MKLCIKSIGESVMLSKENYIRVLEVNVNTAFSMINFRSKEMTGLFLRIFCHYWRNFLKNIQR